MNKKKLGISLVANIISMCVSLGVAFFLTPYLISVLGKEGYSFFPLANNFTGYASIISIALNSMAARFITVSMVAGETDKSKGYFSSVFFSNLILGMIFGIVFLAVIILMPGFLDIPEGMQMDVQILFALVFVGFVVNLVTNVFGVATYAMERTDLNAVLSIVQSLMRVLLYVILFAIFPGNIVILGLVVLALAILNGGVNYLYSRKLMPDYRIERKRNSWRYTRELIGSGMWNSVNSLGANLMSGLSLLIANTMFGASVSGDLSIVQTLPNLITTVISTCFSVFLPHIANVYARGNLGRTVYTVKVTQKILGLISSVPIVLVAIFGRCFFSLWVPGEDALQLQILSLLSLPPLLVSSAMWTVYGLNVVNNKLKIPALIFLMSGGLNAILTILLIKFSDIGVYGIPLVSTLINSVFYTFFLPIYALRQMRMNAVPFISHILKTFLFAGIYLLILNPYVLSLLNINGWVKFFVYGGLAELAGIILYIFIVLDSGDRIMGLNYARSVVRTFLNKVKG